jgi:hypothetical protein
MKITVNKVDYELILLHLSGSRLYGNATEKSDWDYRGVFIAPKETKLGLLGKVEQLEGIEVYKALTKAGLVLEYTDDIVLYEINRFVSLAIDCNPNIVDSIFHTEKYQIYCSSLGKYLLENKKEFLSTKLKFTFSGYAFSQLTRIKSHNKWINEFPDTDKVITCIKEAYSKCLIDYYFILDNFGPNVVKYVNAVETPVDYDIPVLSWEGFLNQYKNVEFVVPLNNYRLPQIYDYAKAIDLRGNVLDKDYPNYNYSKVNNNGAKYKSSIKEFLFYYGSFRTLGQSTIALYTDGIGVLSRGHLKRNEPEVIGDFVCLVKFNHNNLKKDKDHISAMWEWKCKRNVVRGSLEEQFGYDTKHASHLIRLLLGAKSILSINDYNPTLDGESLELVKEVRAGKYGYDWIIAFASTIEKEIDELYKTSTMQKAVNIKIINKILLNLQDDIFVKELEHQEFSKWVVNEIERTKDKFIGFEVGDTVVMETWKKTKVISNITTFNKDGKEKNYIIDFISGGSYVGCSTCPKLFVITRVENNG